MGFALDPISLKHMAGVHPDLVRVVQDCAANSVLPFIFGVSEGLRTIQQQKLDVASGRSTTNNSRHLDGHAVDLVTIIHGKVSWAWPPYHVLAAAMKEAAARVGVPIEAGADWENFPDGPHFQLPREQYPSGAYTPGIRVA